jgi:peptide-methionine (R)-S-oxide reductase
MPTYRKDPDAISRLSREQYRVTQQAATEFPGTGKHLHNKEPGIYVDVVSGEPLFASSDKFDAGTGWPSFTRPIEPAGVNEVPDGTSGIDAGAAPGLSRPEAGKRWTSSSPRRLPPASAARPF